MIECPDVIELPGSQSVQDLDLVVCAHDMPVENGLWLVDRLHAARPCMPAILLAVYCPSSLNDDLASRSFAWLVEKPVSYDAMHVLIHELATRSSSRAGGATVH